MSNIRPKTEYTPKNPGNTSITDSGNSINGKCVETSKGGKAKCVKLSPSDGPEKKDLNKREVELSNELRVHSQMRKASCLKRDTYEHIDKLWMKSELDKPSVGPYLEVINEEYGVSEHWMLCSDGWPTSDQRNKLFTDECRVTLKAFEEYPRPFTEANIGYYVFKAKLLNKLGRHKEYVEIYKKILEILKKSKHENAPDCIKKAQFKVFKHTLLMKGPLANGAIKSGEGYIPTDLLKRVIYADNDLHKRIDRLLETLKKHPSPLIQLLLRLNALEVTMNKSLKILMFGTHSEEYGFPSTSAGSFNHKNRLVSRIDIDTFIHELMHKTLHRIFHPSFRETWRTPYDKENLETLSKLVAECELNSSHETFYKHWTSHAFLACLDIKNAFEYNEEQQAEEIIVRYIAMIAKYPDIEKNPIFKPLNDYVNEKIRPKMEAVLKAHPNRGFLREELHSRKPEKARGVHTGLMLRFINFLYLLALKLGVIKAQRNSRL